MCASSVHDQQKLGFLVVDIISEIIQVGRTEKVLSNEIQWC